MTFKFTAELLTGSMDPESVAPAIDADNLFNERENYVKCSSREGCISTVIKTNKLRTLISTMDDVIKCQIAAERVLE